jgi:hypothetical protein
MERFGSLSKTSCSRNFCERHQLSQIKGVIAKRFHWIALLYSNCSPFAGNYGHATNRVSLSAPPRCSLQGLRVVIIGGTSGFGMATAKAASAEGASVIIAPSKQSNVDRALADLPSGAKGYVLDITQEPAVCQNVIGHGQHLLLSQCFIVFSAPRSVPRCFHRRGCRPRSSAAVIAKAIQEHRLEAYATLFYGLSSDLSGTSESYRRAPGVATQRRNVA